MKSRTTKALWALIAVCMLVGTTIALAHPRKAKPRRPVAKEKIIPIEQLPIGELLKIVKSKVMVDDLDTVRGQTSIQDVNQRIVQVRKFGTWSALANNASYVSLPNGGFGGVLTVRGRPTIEVSIELNTQVTNVFGSTTDVSFRLLWNGEVLTASGSDLPGLDHLGSHNAGTVGNLVTVKKGGLGRVFIPSSAVKNGTNTWELQYRANILGSNAISIGGSVRAQFVEHATAAQFVGFESLDQNITF